MRGGGCGGVSGVMAWASRQRRRGGVILIPALHPTPPRIAPRVKFGDPESKRCSFRLARGGRRNSSSPVEDKAGDDEHRRHRQRLRERFRGRPFCGFLHANLPRLGHDSSLARARLRRSDDYSENPTTNIRFRFESPLSEHRRHQVRPVMRRHFGSVAAGLCAWEGIFKAHFWRAGRSRIVPPVAGAWAAS